MKIRHIIISVAALLMVTVAGAKGSRGEQSKLYMFGLAASFTDTIVHFTSIQEVDSAWVTKKKDFLLGRELYSYQMRDYLTSELLMPHRTCIVIYDKKRKKLEKKYAKMTRLYTTPRKGARQYDVRHIGEQNFRFTSVDMSETLKQEEEQVEVKQKPKKGPKGDKRPPKDGMKGGGRGK